MINQKVRDEFFNELLKAGYSEDGPKKIWVAANRSLLHYSPELSKSFLKLLEFEPYKKNVLEKEMDLINFSGRKFARKIGKKPFNLIDIGCGNGLKAREFVKSMNPKVKIRYVPVSPDNYLTKLAVKNLKESDFEQVKEYKEINEGYENLSSLSTELRSSEYNRSVILLHGSILASYEINDYLFNLTSSMMKGDFVLIGNGIRTGERLVDLDKYRNKVFDNWFIHLMKSLGFKESELEYDAKFSNTRVDCFYRIKKPRIIRNKGKTIKFNKGDEVIVFYLYKYYFKELDKFFKMYFRKVYAVRDKEEEYSVSLCAK